MKIEKTPRGYLLSANGGNRIEFYREFNAVEAWACAAFDELMNERDALRAKIEAMEKQEPVWFIDERGAPKRYHKSKADYCKYGGLDLLYALPGAKGE